MYASYYRLSAKPFENTPDPRFLFLSQQHREALHSLLYGIEAAKGFILVAGDIGTGKTTLIRALLKEINPAYIILNVINPRTNFDEIYGQLVQILGVRVEGLNRLEGIEKVRARLEELNREKQRVVIMIDEAHLLSEESLEEIRLLSNIESEETKLLQIVLVGQNEIYNLLNRESLQPLKQRIVINRQLTALNQEVAIEYIQHRLLVAGRQGPLFTKDALALIGKSSGGVPRLINQICDNALLIGYAIEAEMIGKKIINEVLDDMEQVPRTRRIPVPSWSADPKIWALAGVLLLVLAGYVVSTIAPGGMSGLVAGLSSSPASEARVTKKTPPRPTSGERAGASGPGKMLTVQPQEFLSALAVREYGSGSATETVLDLIQMANPQITDIHKIYPGEKILLPKITRNSLISKKEAETYRIHYASFYSIHSAQLATRRLRGLGKEVEIVAARQGEVSVYRVYIGRFRTRAEAEAAARTIDFKNLPFLNAV